MTIIRFTSYMWYSTDRPSYISEVRWNAMLRFWELNRQHYVID